MRWPKPPSTAGPQGASSGRLLRRIGDDGPVGSCVRSSAECTIVRMTLVEPADGDVRSMRERMLAGDLYRGADAELEAEMRQAMVLTKAFNDSDPLDPDGRR